MIFLIPETQQIYEDLSGCRRIIPKSGKSA
jgi:hypothetical protein